VLEAESQLIIDGSSTEEPSPRFFSTIAKVWAVRGQLKAVWKPKMVRKNCTRGEVALGVFVVVPADFVLRATWDLLSSRHWPGDVMNTVRVQILLVQPDHVLSPDRCLCSAA
jgi:hypothetical protein